MSDTMISYLTVVLLAALLVITVVDPTPLLVALGAR